MIVVDTNIVAYLFIEGERTDAVRQVRKRDPEWRLPSLWRSEFLNVASTLVSGDLLTMGQARSAWRSASVILRGSEHVPDGEAVLTAAVERRISAYDAQFVVTAEDLGLQLVTTDRGILGACPGVAVAPEEFVGS